MVRVLFPGSFDPVTFGHIDLIERGLVLFDSVTVAIAANSQKAPMFSVDERVNLLGEVLPAAVEVTSFEGLVIDFCKREGYGAILRGLRNTIDFEFEHQMALTNRQMCDSVDTVFVMPDPKYSFVASSLVKDIVRGGGDVSSFVPAAVEAQMLQKLSP